MEKKEVNRIATIVNKHLLGREIDEGSDMYGIAKDIIQELEQELDKAREEGYQNCMDDIWEKARGLISNMEKIEKLQEFNWLEGRDALTIALDNTIIKKLNEVIDYLNFKENLFTEKELEILLYLVKSRDRDMNRMWVRKTLPDYEIEVSRNLVKKLEDLSKLRQ